MAKQGIIELSEVTLFKTFNFNPKQIWGTNYDVEFNQSNLTARVKNNEPFFREKDFSRWNKLTMVGQYIYPTYTKTAYGLTVNGNRVYFNVTISKLKIK